MNNYLIRFFLLVCLSSFASLTVADHHESMVFELRTYTTHDGMLPALESRFRDHTMRIFEKHGMKNIGYWTPIDKPNTLVYIIAHASREAAGVSWQAFISDPEWQKVAEESQKNGPLLIKGGIQTQYLNPTDFSPIR